jgi:hypothetical protein
VISAAWVDLIAVAIAGYVALKGLCEVVVYFSTRE